MLINEITSNTCHQRWWSLKLEKCELTIRSREISCFVLPNLLLISWFCSFEENIRICWEHRTSKTRNNKTNIYPQQLVRLSTTQTASLTFLLDLKTLIYENFHFSNVPKSIRNFNPLAAWSYHLHVDIFAIQTPLLVRMFQHFWVVVSQRHRPDVDNTLRYHRSLNRSILFYRS